MGVFRALPPVSASPLTVRQLWRGAVAPWMGGDPLAQRRDEFKAYLGVSHAYPVSSGKAALYLALKVLQQCAPGTEVVVPAYTCFSVPSAVVKAGLKVVPCDVDPETFDFDYQQLESAVTPRTLCVVATHLFGLPADLERIKALAVKRGVYVIEDAAQAFGVERDGVRAGTSGDVGIYSFGRGKHVTCGSGGLAVTNRPDLGRLFDLLYETLPEPAPAKSAVEWGIVAAMQVFLRPWLYWIPAGLPFLKLGHTVFDPSFPVEKLSRMKAYLLEGWREQLEQGNRIRRHHVQQIAGALKGKPFSGNSAPLLRIPVLCRSGSHRRDMQEAGRSIGVGGMYPSGIHLIPGLAGGGLPEGFPGATTIAERVVTLPTHHLVVDGDEVSLAQLLSATDEGVGPAHPGIKVEGAVKGSPSR